MHKSEPRANLTLIIYANRYMSSEWGPLGPIGVLAPLKSNSKVDSTSYYRESTEVQYPM